MPHVDVYELFTKLGLPPPTSVHIFAGEWSQEGFQVTYGVRGSEQLECTCCECNLDIGPPGCDGSDCRRCGDSRCGG